ncbi:MAG TPA: hypothetical protein VFF27_09335 [Bacteroidia bacterium]|jgi:hypothetical protein|nr:hypothetical protein [Bacteroidia bacterium]
MLLIAGKIMKEFSDTPYPTITKKDLQIEIMIENRPTKLVRKHKRTVLSLGKLNWKVSALHQKADDYF